MGGRKGAGRESRSDGDGEGAKREELERRRARRGRRSGRRRVGRSGAWLERLSMLGGARDRRRWRAVGILGGVVGFTQIVYTVGARESKVGSGEIGGKRSERERRSGGWEPLVRLGCQGWPGRGPGVGCCWVPAGDAGMTGMCPVFGPMCPVFGQMCPLSRAMCQLLGRMCPLWRRGVS